MARRYRFSGAQTECNLMLPRGFWAITQDGCGKRFELQLFEIRAQASTAKWLKQKYLDFRS
jgi:hypothetical protein